MGLRLARIALWIAGVTAIIFLLDLVGIPVSDWIRTLFDKIAQVPPGAVIGGVVLETLQTTLAALAWLGILRAAFPNAGISFRMVLASYAAAVAMNSFLPANIGTWAMLIMFTALIAGATFLAVFLGAYGIPVTFHNVATVTASNSVANSVAVTPGGIGVTQAANTAALRDSASASDATAYSVAQQLIVSAWDAVFAVVVVSWAFGWSGGKELVESSYGEAKVKTQEMKEQRAAKKRARSEV